MKIRKQKKNPAQCMTGGICNGGFDVPASAGIQPPRRYLRSPSSLMNAR